MATQTIWDDHGDPLAAALIALREAIRSTSSSRGLQRGRSVLMPDDALVLALLGSEERMFTAGPSCEQIDGELSRRSAPMPEGSRNQEMPGAISGEEEECTCSICLEDMAPGQFVVSPKQCRHLFHVSCLKSACRQAAKCPLCRSAVVEHEQRSNHQEGEEESRRQGTHNATSLDERFDVIVQLAAQGLLQAALRDSTEEQTRPSARRQNTSARERLGLFRLGASEAEQSAAIEEESAHSREEQTTAAELPPSPSRSRRRHRRRQPGCLSCCVM